MHRRGGYPLLSASRGQPGTSGQRSLLSALRVLSPLVSGVYTDDVTRWVKITEIIAGAVNPTRRDRPRCCGQPPVQRPATGVITAHNSTRVIGIQTDLASSVDGGCPGRSRRVPVSPWR